MPFDLASAVGQTQAPNASAARGKAKGTGAGFADLLDQVMSGGQGATGAKPKGFVGKLASVAASVQDGSAAASGLAALQGVMPGLLSVQGSPQPPAGLTAAADALTKAQGSGADPAALKAQAGALLDRLNKAEARLTGVDPTAAPEGWTEPQAFAQTRAALTALMGDGSPTAAGASSANLSTTSATAQTLAALNTADGAAQGAPAQPATAAATTQAAQGQAGVAGAAAAQAASAANAAAAAQIMPAAPPAPGDVAPLSAAKGSAAATGKAADKAEATSAASANVQASAAGSKTASAPADQAVADAAQRGPHDPTDDKPQDPASDTIKTADAARAPDQPANATPTATPAQAAYQAADVNAAAAQAAVRGSPEATAFLAAQLVKRLDGQSTRFEMQLHPADLGRVDVQMRIEQDGRLNAQMAFDNPVAAADFRAHADELRRQLEQAGFQLSDNSLSFTDRNPQQQGQSSGQGFGQGFGQSTGHAFGQDWTASPSSAATDPVAASAAITSTGQTQLGLDLKV